MEWEQGWAQAPPDKEIGNRNRKMPWELGCLRGMWGHQYGVKAVQGVVTMGHRRLLMPDKGALTLVAGGGPPKSSACGRIRVAFSF